MLTKTLHRAVTSTATLPSKLASKSTLASESTLDTLAPRQSAHIVRLSGFGLTRRRIMELGLVPGTVVTMVRRAPMGDPLELEVRGYRLSLRLKDAKTITIQHKPVGRPSPTIVRLKPFSSQASSAQTQPDQNSAAASTPKVLLLGNPNSGKTTLFNRLSGLRAKIGNYPGVTVEKKSAQVRLQSEQSIELVDLPGSYSLRAHSPEERICMDEVMGLGHQPPDAVVMVADATALRRSLYLASQLAEMPFPLVIAINMWDEAQSLGIEVNLQELQKRFNAQCIPISASTGFGVDDLRNAIAESITKEKTDSASPRRYIQFAEPVESFVQRAAQQIPAEWHHDEHHKQRAWAQWALLSIDQDDFETIPIQLRTAVQSLRDEAQSAHADIDQQLIQTRYEWIDSILSSVQEGQVTRRAAQERLDTILLQPFAGTAIFIAVMFAIFQSLFLWVEPLIAGIEKLVGDTQQLVQTWFPAGPFQDLLVYGIIAGVGNVIVFVPQIALLFFLIALLEDSGYLARVGFVIDRLMGSVGLHGKAFIPMLGGFACAIPAVMATRTIESRKDRLLTMMVVPLMSCSARLPVYVLIAAVIFNPSDKVLGVLSLGAVALFSMYLLSMFSAIGVAAVLRRTVLRGPRPTLLLELPPFRKPTMSSLLRNAWDHVKAFITEAGTVILAMTIILWAMLSYPRLDTDKFVSEPQATATRQDTSGEYEREQSLEQAQLEYSFAGRFGKAVEPIMEPLGFDWRITVGIIGAFAAREVFVSTLGVVFGMSDADENSTTLRKSLKTAVWPDGRKLMTPIAGFSLMIFFVLACQCMSTIAVVRRESGSWRWPAFLVAYMSVLAYVASMCVFQLGTALGIGT